MLSELGPKVHHAGVVGNASKVEFALWLSYMFQTITGAEHLVPQMARRTYTSEMWSVDNFAASIPMITDFAEGVSLPTRLIEEIRDIYTTASSLGHGDKDVAAIYETFMDDASETKH